MFESLMCVCGSECVLCLGQFGVDLWECDCAMCGKVWCEIFGVNLCSLWDILLWAFWKACVLCVGRFVVGFWW